MTALVRFGGEAIAKVWRWQFFIGPVEIRRWVPLEVSR
jgi:hypothetical protein